MKNFQNTFLHTVPENNISELNPCEQGAIIGTHRDLLEKRKKGKPLVHISRTECDNPGDERTVIDIIADDKPFLVDSIVAEINRHSLFIDFLIHPHVYAEFKDQDFTRATNKKDADNTRQSHIHIRLHRLIPKNMEKKLLRGLKRALIDVRLATRDWQALKGHVVQCRDLIAQNAPKNKENTEYTAFLEYIHDNNFTLLGYRYFAAKNKKFSVQPKKSLGILKPARDIDFLENYETELPELFKKLAQQKKPLNVFKMNRDSSVHRRVPIDAISVQDLDKNGKVIGFHLIIGLFTSVTYSRSVTDIPYLRLKVDKVLSKFDYVEGSHDDKAMRHILEKFPRDELFQIELPRLQKTASSILSLQEKQRIALFMRPDIFGRSVSCMIYIPRDRFDTRMRKRFEKILEAELDGTTKAFYTTLDDSVFARIILLIESNNAHIKKYNEKALEDTLRLEGRAWDEALAEAINIKHGDAADDLVERYTGAFPTSYREHYNADKALNDIKMLERFQENGENIRVSFYRDKTCEAQQLRLKLYVRNNPAPLSDALPILENMGLRVVSELPFKVKCTHNGKREIIWIQDFLMQSDSPDLEGRMEMMRPLAREAFTMIWAGKMQNDSLNRLVMSASLSWREIVILRTYVHYIRQLNVPFSRLYISNALTKHPEIARLLVDIFAAYFNPKNAKESEKYAKACGLVIQDELENVSSLDEDRILRSILNLINATLRTNFYQEDENGDPKEYLSIKIDSAQVENMPLPRPYREIFVYSPRVEGIHLRGGPIARGGIRWSDRAEDYRTEVLGLMKAQQVKNAVIVPVGSKGGFILKDPPTSGGRDAFIAEGIACYKIFIRGLLDITDNRKGTKIVPPQNVVRRDSDDPYLVVAADKGTATFSDIANGLSQEYGFWLDDAFASGGSAGYDHKVMGITARGAWESVMRHFAELNHDTQTEEFEVIGVGDMGGDVFGNGMLLSKKIRLIGAFNHLHIFCDPNPDPAETWKERKRLFDGVKGWDAYNTDKLSKGGRIYSRSDKELDLTPEIKKAFGLSKDKVTPFELMHAMLKAKTDLLWFGGIGTYIKAEDESNSDVGDKANDAIRVNAKELHAKVLGEGANLAITQLGRIEFAKNRGALNADFIDNSGGVDSSDHEVNIKILMQAVMEDKRSKMDLKARNKLLEKMTETVALHVLNNNRVQAEAISLMQLDAPENMNAQAELITAYEQDFGLNRALEGLPDTEAINVRLKLGKGLTRPELSTLQSYAKIKLTNDLMATKVPDHPSLTPWLISYFPKQLRTDYVEEIKQHRLRREIISMKLANNIVNRMGPSFMKHMKDLTGASIEQITRAYLIAKDMIDLKDLWAEVNDSKYNILAFVRLKALKELSDLTEILTLWILKNIKGQLDIDKQLSIFHPAMQNLKSFLPALLPEAQSNSLQQNIAAHSSDGFPDKISKVLSLTKYLDAAPDIIRIAATMKQKDALKNVASVYFQIGEQFHFDWLSQKAVHIAAEDKWNKRAKSAQIEQLRLIQAALCEKILKNITAKKNAPKTIEAKHINAWAQAQNGKTDALENMIKQLRRIGQIDLAMLTLAAETLRKLCDK